MARKHKGGPEAIDSSPAGIARALCVKGNADAEIAIAQTRVVRGGVSIDFLKSLLPPPTPAPHRITIAIPGATCDQGNPTVAFTRLHGATSLQQATDGPTGEIQR